MPKLTRPQEAALIRLFKSPKRRSGVRNGQTAEALLRKGYIEEVHGLRTLLGKPIYVLTQAGVRYNQTGREKGE